MIMIPATRPAQPSPNSVPAHTPTPAPPPSPAHLPISEWPDEDPPILRPRHKVLAQGGQPGANLRTHILVPFELALQRIAAAAAAAVAVAQCGWHQQPSLSAIEGNHYLQVTAPLTLTHTLHPSPGAGRRMRDHTHTHYLPREQADPGIPPPPPPTPLTHTNKE